VSKYFLFHGRTQQTISQSFDNFQIIRYNQFADCNMNHIEGFYSEKLLTIYNGYIALMLQFSVSMLLDFFSHSK